MKDLPDIALLAGVREVDAGRLRAALEQTFTTRKTHAVLGALPMPPASWTAPHARMVEEDELHWADLGTLVGAVQAFLDPLLSGGAAGTWMPTAWSWAA